MADNIDWELIKKMSDISSGWRLLLQIKKQDSFSNLMCEYFIHWVD